MADPLNIIDKYNGFSALKTKDWLFFVLPCVLIVLVLLTAYASSFLNSGMRELKTTVKNRDYELCLLIAYNTMAIAQGELEKDLNYLGTSESVAESNGGSYEIKLSTTGENKRFLEIKARFNQFTKKFSGNLEMIPGIENELKIKIMEWRLLE